MMSSCALKKCAPPCRQTRCTKKEVDFRHHLSLQLVGHVDYREQERGPLSPQAHGTMPNLPCSLASWKGAIQTAPDFLCLECYIFFKCSMISYGTPSKPKSNQNKQNWKYFKVSETV